MQALKVIVIESPSSFADPSTWQKYQYPVTGGPAFSCFRPFVGPPLALPASLVSPVFGRFLENAGLELSALGRCDAESTCLQQLLSFMPRYHKYERELQLGVNSVLASLFGRSVVPFKTNEPASHSTTDGGVLHKVDGVDVLVALVEYKRDAFNSSGDPHFQMLRELQMFWEQGDRARSRLFATDPCPTLLIEVAGPLMRVSAAASLQANRVQSEPLTPFLAVLPMRDQPQHTTALLAMLRALKLAVHELWGRYSDLDLSSLNDEEKSCSSFASSSEGEQAGCCSRDPGLQLPHMLRGKGCGFAGVELLFPDKLLYVATRCEPRRGSGDDGDQHSSRGILRLPPQRVCIKFSRHAYAADVHRAWAAAGLAPALWRSERLPGGMHMVEMELLDPEEGWILLDMLKGHDDRRAGLGAALEALKRAHQVKLPCGGVAAHGDCRGVNVMLRPRSKKCPPPITTSCSSSASAIADDDVAHAQQQQQQQQQQQHNEMEMEMSAASVLSLWEVRFVDFDWAGVSGARLYPPLMSASVQWPLGATSGTPLLQSHDLDLLQSTAFF